MAKKTNSGISIPFLADMSEFDKSVKTIDNKVKSLNPTIKTLKDSLKIDLDTSKFSQAQDLIKQKYEALTEKANAFRDKIKEVNNLDAEAAKSKRLEQYAKDIQNTEEKVLNLKKAIEETSKAQQSGDNAAKLDELNKKLSEAEQKYKALIKDKAAFAASDAESAKIAQIAELNTRLTFAETNIKKVSKEYADLNKLKLDNMQKDIELATDKADLLHDKLDMKFSFNTFGELKKTWGDALEKTSEKASELRKILADMEKADPAAKQTAEFKELENQLTELENAAKSLDRNLNEILGKTLQTAGVNIENLGKSLLPLSAGATAALTVATKAAIDQESAFAGVKKTVEATESEYAALKQQLIDLSEVIPLSAKELMGIAESAGQLGIEKENIIAFTQVMADLGVATNLTGEEAASIFAKFANITQMPQESFSRLGSSVVALGKCYCPVIKKFIA